MIAKRTITAMLMAVLALPVLAQDAATPADTSYWKRSFKAGLTFNQASFSSNWKAGGVNSIGFNSFVNFQANYLKGKHSWDNQIDLQYGYVNNEGQGARKSIDRIFLDTKYGYQISEHWNTFLALNFVSQFAKGFQYDDVGGIEQSLLISDFLSPAFITTSWGFEYVPTDYFNLRLAPFAPRITIVANDDVFDNVENNYGVDPGENVRYEWLAFQALADFDKDLTDNINLKMIYILFMNYQELSFKQIDHRFDGILTASITKYIDVNLFVSLLYDRDQDDDVQVSQGLGIGFMYKIANFKEKD